MQHVKFWTLFFLLLCIIASKSKAQNNSDSFFIALKKSSPDFFTIYINIEKSKESIDVYTGTFPTLHLIYSEKLIRIDSIKKHKHFILLGKKSSVYKKGNTFFAEFTGFEDEGYKTKLTPCSIEKAYPDIAKNCNYKVKQISMLRFHLDSILGHDNYSADFASFDDENSTFNMINLPFKSFKDSIDFKVKMFFNEVLIKEKPEVERLKNIFKSIEKISYTTAEKFIIKTDVKTNIEKEIIYCIAEKHPAMFIEILEKGSNTIPKKIEIIRTFQEYGTQNIKYKSLYNSLSKSEANSKTKQVLLKNLKKGKRHANFLKTITVASGMIALISIPIMFIVIINL